MSSQDDRGTFNKDLNDESANAAIEATVVSETNSEDVWESADSVVVQKIIHQDVENENDTVEAELEHETVETEPAHEAVETELEHESVEGDLAADEQVDVIDSETSDLDDEISSEQDAEEEVLVEAESDEVTSVHGDDVVESSELFEGSNADATNDRDELVDVSDAADSEHNDHFENEATFAKPDDLEAELSSSYEPIVDELEASGEQEQADVVAESAQNVAEELESGSNDLTAAEETDIDAEDAGVEAEEADIDAEDAGIEAKEANIEVEEATMEAEEATMEAEEANMEDEAAADEAVSDTSHAMISESDDETLFEVGAEHDDNVEDLVLDNNNIEKLEEASEFAGSDDVPADSEGVATGFEPENFTQGETEEVANQFDAPPGLTEMPNVAQGLSVCLFQLNSEGRLIFANEAFLAQFSMANESEFIAAVEASSDDDITAPRAFMETLAEAAAQGGANAQSIQHPGMEPGVNLTVWLTPVGEIWNGCAIEETQRQDVEVESLREQHVDSEKLNAAQSELLSIISQEIRTPMNGIIGMTDYLESTELGIEQRRYTSVIRQGAESLLAIINDILDFSTMESGTLELKSAPTDLHELVEQVLDRHAVAARGKGLQIGVAVDRNVPKRVKVDSKRLSQVLDNLFENAVKFTSAGGILLEVAELSRADGVSSIRFTVSDTGSGISRDLQTEIFAGHALPFGEGDEPRGSAGLGLSIARAVVARLGGEVKLQSIPSEGSTFTFEIELSVLPAQEGDEDIISQSAVLADRRILAVDDSAINRMVLARQLESLGMRPTVVPSASEALHALQQAREIGEPFEIAILDHLMSGVDGVELCVRIREMSEFADMKLILASAAAPMDADRKLPTNGFDALLPKPLRPAVTRNALAGLYDNSRQDSNIYSLGVEYRANSNGGVGNGDNFSENARRETVRVQAKKLLELFGGPGDNSPDTEQTPTKTTGSTSGETDLTAPNAPTRPDGKPRILVAEDNHVNQQLAELILVTNGYDVRIVEDGVKAVEAVQEEEFDLVLMDIQMPNMDGLDATREIRKLDGEVANIPVLALTANVMPGDADICFEAGMDSYVAKPVRQDLLLEEMRKYLSKAQNQNHSNLVSGVA